MKKYLLAVVPLILVAGFLIMPADADNPFQNLIQNILAKIANHELRITNLEEKTSTTVASNGANVSITNMATGQTQSLITLNCEIIDAGEQVVRGWCPNPSYQTYLIEDIRVLENTLVLFNVQDPSGFAPIFVIVDSGFMELGANTYQGFLLRLSASVDPQPSNTLIYSVFV